MPRKLSKKQVKFAAAGNPVRHYSAQVQDLFNNHVEKVLLDAGLEHLSGEVKCFLNKLTLYKPSHPILGPGRYVNVYRETLKKLFGGGRTYVIIIDLLLEKGIIQRLTTPTMPDGSFKKDGYSKAYRISPQHWPDEPRNPALSARVKHDDNTSYKIWHEQQDYLKTIKTDVHRLGLSQMTQLICSTLDEEQAWQDVNVLYSRDKNHRFGDASKANTMDMREAIDFVRSLRDGKYYSNPRDGFGARFHWPLTNSPRQIRQYVRPEPGVKALEIDFKNSQYYLFALVAKHPAAVLAMMKDSEVNVDLLKMIEQVGPAYMTHSDLREFCDQALQGTLYRWLAGQIGLDPDNEDDIEAVKKMLMKTLMSDHTEYAPLKKMLSEHIPNVVAICGDLNKPTEEAEAEWRRIEEELSLSERSIKERRKVKEEHRTKENTVPKVLQNLESVIVVDNIAVSAIGNNAKRFTTIHDSFLTHPDNERMITYLLTDFFNFFGIPSEDHPKVKVKQLEGSNCPEAAPEELARVPEHRDLY